jgi:hypothetical protein
VGDPALRRRIGDAARKDVLEAYHPDAIARRQVRPLLMRLNSPLTKSALI